MSFDGHTMVTPNSNTADATRINVLSGTIVDKTPTGTLPIATGMMPDASKYYVSNYVDSTITCIAIGAPSCQTSGGPVAVKTISLLANYDPVSGAITGPIGGLPIQTPVSPHGKWVITANFTADSAVAYMRPDKTFSLKVTEAALLDTKEDAEAMRKLALRMERIVSDPYLMEVSPTPAGLDLLSARERIRANGPTVRVRRPDPSPISGLHCAPHWAQRAKFASRKLSWVR